MNQMNQTKMVVEILDHKSRTYDKGIAFETIPNGQIFMGALRFWCPEPPHFSAAIGDRGPWMKATGELIAVGAGTRWSMGEAGWFVVDYMTVKKVILLLREDEPAHL